jgi:hypothetical protein
VTWLSWILALLGWCAAGVVVGLWLGERGRRLDLLHHLGKEERTPGPPPGPVVRRRPHEDELLLEAHEVAALAEHLEEEAVAEGKQISPEAALEEAKQLLQEGYSAGGRPG